jgi:hypothetical protein
MKSRGSVAPGGHPLLEFRILSDLIFWATGTVIIYKSPEPGFFLFSRSNMLLNLYYEALSTNIFSLFSPVDFIGLVKKNSVKCGTVADR